MRPVFHQRIAHLHWFGARSMGQRFCQGGVSRARTAASTALPTNTAPADSVTGGFIIGSTGGGVAIRSKVSFPGCQLRGPRGEMGRSGPTGGRRPGNGHLTSSHNPRESCARDSISSSVDDNNSHMDTDGHRDLIRFPHQVRRNAWRVCGEGVVTVIRSC
jgi:hypothetical protein